MRFFHPLASHRVLGFLRLNLVDLFGVEVLDT